MLTLFSIAVLGFFLGMRHATDADHVIAVSAIVSRQRGIPGAVFIGALWGLGHTLTLMLVGAAIVFFGMVIPPRLGMSMEFSVGLMLIFLGVWNLKSFLRTEVRQRSAEAHGHADHHDDQGPAKRWIERRFEKLPFYQSVRPFAVGVVHGMAGSAALALLVLPMIHNPIWAMSYLAIFGVGTIAGMMLITGAIAWPCSFAVSRSETLHRRLAVASGFISLGFGVFMVYEIGVVQGLFFK